MKKQCKLCGTEYEAKRATSRYCSRKCKLAYHRKTDPAEVTVSNETLRPTNETLRVDADETLKTDHTQDIIQLAQHESKRQSRADNQRPLMPGDAGYNGVCHKVDGVWQVKPEYTGPITPDLIAEIKATAAQCRAEQQARVI